MLLHFRFGCFVLVEVRIAEPDEFVALRRARRQTSQGEKRRGRWDHGHGVSAGKPGDVAIFCEQRRDRRADRRRRGGKKRERKLAKSAVGRDDQCFCVFPAGFDWLQQLTKEPVGERDIEWGYV